MSFQRFEKLEWNELESPMALPSLRQHTVNCPKCNYRHPVQSTYTDWREVSERYKEAYSKMTEEFVEMLKEAGEVFDVPLKEYFEASQLEILQRLREAIKEAQQ